jgi:D-glycero-alpha-D-manno-heptose-7-phosphate kinase
LLRQQSADVASPGGKSDATSHLAKLAEQAFSELCSGKLDSLGPMLHEAWQMKKQIADGISNGLIDQAYGAAIRAGAEGGKLLGAGGGGFLMFLAAPERHDAIRTALQSMRETPFQFVSHGSRIIFVH